LTLIILKTITIKNFMSIGAVSQTVDLTQHGLTLVLGENLDLGGNDARNGVGKSSMISAICYALYGQALTNIKKNNLINSINKKNMSVSIEFEAHGVSYKIERGRAPNFFKYFVNNEAVSESQNNDEAQGENKDTQKEIDRVLGISHTMFRHIVALNTYTGPFLSLGAGKQRELIEELLGITLLSQKAENLKKLIQATKQSVEQEEFKIHTLKNSNARILTAIEELNQRRLKWAQSQASKIQELTEGLDALQHLDVETEIQAHKINVAYRELQTSERNLRAQLKSKTTQHQQLSSQQTHLLTQYSQVQNHNCAMCGQTLHDSKQTSILSDLESKITKLDTSITTLQTEIEGLNGELIEISGLGEGLNPQTTLYQTVDEAYAHKNSVAMLEKELGRAREETNPYEAQSGSLNNTLQEVSYDTLNQLTNLRDHQEFLLKLLTSKDSFIRKKIIDQNLNYLNHRLSEYLANLNLPHSVRFSNDLGVDIAHMGVEFDFDSLSRGERTRVCLALSWAFRDIFENMNTSINFMAVDEILDLGLDTSGLEKSLEVLKRMSRDRNKNILLISHREELQSRCDHTLTVLKENGFTRFEWDYVPSV
jgi:DNA repair exonuclease SbcCD ATPase subunit